MRGVGSLDLSGVTVCIEGLVCVGVDVGVEEIFRLSGIMELNTYSECHAVRELWRCHWLPCCGTCS